MTARPAADGSPASGRQEPARGGTSLALLTSGALIVAKIVLALATGSVAVLAEAAHSAADLLASIVAAVAVRGEGERRSADVEIGAVEGVFVCAASAVIVFAALRQLGDPVDAPKTALLGMCVCAVVSGVAAVRIRRLGGDSPSRAQRSDVQHLRLSTVTTVIVVAALGLIELTDVLAFDALTAVAIALVVARAGVELLLGVRPGGEQLEPDELEAVTATVAAGPPEVVGYRHLRARTTGGMRRIDVDVTVRADVEGARAREVWSELHRDLSRRLPGVRVVVHVTRPEPSPVRPVGGRDERR